MVDYCRRSPWGKNSKFLLVSENVSSPCNLKKIVVSYIIENLGDLCNIEPLNNDVIISQGISTTASLKNGVPHGNKQRNQSYNKCGAKQVDNSDINGKLVIPRSVFNIRNYGKIFCGTESSKLPNKDTRLEDAFQRSEYCFTFR